MKALPSNLLKYKSTPAFDQHSVPAGLLKAHQTKAGTWAKIVIVSGKLSCRILEPEWKEWVLSSENHGVVEPTILHEVAPLGDANHDGSAFTVCGRYVGLYDNRHSP